MNVKKVLKISALFLGGAILLALLLMIGLVLFVDPNRFKPLIAEKVNYYTGRQLTMDGQLAWSFYPSLGVQVGHVILGNPTGFSQKTFLEIDHAKVSIKLLPLLLHHRIESNGIILNGVTLNLIKSSNGTVNWKMQKPVAHSLANEKDSTVGLQESNINKNSESIAIDEIDVSHANIHWLDEQSHQQININDLQLQAKDLNLIHPFPLSLSFDFAVPNSPVSGTVKLTTHLALNLAKQIYSLRDLNLIVQTTQNRQPIELKVNGDMIADLTQQTAQWTNFKAQLANLIVTGKMNVGDLTTAPHAIGQFNLESFDVKQWLQQLGQDTTNIKILKNMQGKFNVDAKAAAVDVKGTVSINHVQLKQVTLDDVNVQTHFQNGVLVLSPMTASLYQGTLNGEAKAILTSTIPQFNVLAKLANIQLDALARDVMGKHKITLAGLGNADLTISTAGKTTPALLENLNGDYRLSVNQGSLQGIDIGYLINHAYSLIKNQSVSSTNSNKTDFGNLTGSGVIRNGVILNDNLLLDSSVFEVKGKGLVNLVKQQIDYQLQAVLKQNTATADWQSLYGLPIPISITGDLADPSIRLDAAVLVKALAQQQLEKAKNQVKEKIQEQIKQQVPGNANQLLQNLLH